MMRHSHSTATAPDRMEPISCEAKEHTLFVEPVQTMHDGVAKP